MIRLRQTASAALHLDMGHGGLLRTADLRLENLQIVGYATRPYTFDQAIVLAP